MATYLPQRYLENSREPTARRTTDAESGAASRMQEQRPQLELRSLQTQKVEAIGSLAGAIAHDFNNLMTIILGCSSVLLERMTDDESATIEVQRILNAAHQATALARQLLESNRQRVAEPEATDLNAVVGEVLGLVGGMIGDDILVNLDLQPDITAIRADRVQLQQVLLNLVVNARQAMQTGGRLEIRTADVMLDELSADEHPDAAVGRYVLLEVSDTGYGMDDETRRHAFDPYFTTKQDGTGVGLASVYNILKQNGGHILLDSQPGTGATFRLYFPA